MRDQFPLTKVKGHWEAPCTMKRDALASRFDDEGGSQRLTKQSRGKDTQDELRRTIAALAAAILMLMPGLATAQQGRPGPSQLILDLANKWVEAYNTGDAKALAALYTEDATLFISGFPRSEGRDLIEEVWAADMGVGAPLTVLTVTDEVVGVDMRLVHGNYQVVNRDTGAAEGSGRFAHVWVLQKDGETWLLYVDLWQDPTYLSDAASQ